MVQYPTNLGKGFCSQSDGMIISDDYLSCTHSHSHSQTSNHSHSHSHSHCHSEHSKTSPNLSQMNNNCDCNNNESNNNRLYRHICIQPKKGLLNSLLKPQTQQQDENESQRRRQGQGQGQQPSQSNCLDTSNNNTVHRARILSQKQIHSYRNRSPSNSSNHSSHTISSSTTNARGANQVIKILYQESGQQYNDLQTMSNNQTINEVTTEMSGTNANKINNINGNITTNTGIQEEMDTTEETGANIESTRLESIQAAAIAKKLKQVKQAKQQQQEQERLEQKNSHLSQTHGHKGVRRGDNENGDLLIHANDRFDECGRYIALEMLGKGTFGQVIKCYDRLKQGYIALKVIRNKEAYHKQAKVEIKILELLEEKCKLMRHSGIINLERSFEHENHLCLVFPLMHINLFQLMKNNNYAGFTVTAIRVFVVYVSFDFLYIYVSSMFCVLN